MSIRLFIALPLPDQVRTVLAEAQRKMQEQGIRGRYVPPENMHLTLAFLGSRSLECTRKIREAFVSLSMTDLHLEIEGGGHFGSLLFARVFDTPALNELAGQIRGKMKSICEGEDERPFQAHITLVRKCSDLNAAQRLIEPLAFDVRSCVLYQSRSGKTAPEYQVLAQIESAESMEGPTSR